MSEADITYTVRHIDGYTQHSATDGDASMVLACRDDTGGKVWIKLDGLSVGAVLDYVIKNLAS